MNVVEKKLKELKKANASEEEIQNEGICRKICYSRMEKCDDMGGIKGKTPDSITKR